MWPMGAILDSAVLEHKSTSFPPTESMCRRAGMCTVPADHILFEEEVPFSDLHKVGCRPTAALSVIHVWTVRWEERAARGFWKNFLFLIQRRYPRRNSHPSFPTQFCHYQTERRELQQPEDRSACRGAEPEPWWAGLGGCPDFWFLVMWDEKNIPAYWLRYCIRILDYLQLKVTYQI